MLAKDLYQAANDLNISTLVEVHSENEAEIALSFENSIIGINNRNLKTLEISLNTSVKLSKILNSHKNPLICESGIHSIKEIKFIIENAKIHNFLIGESLLRSKDIASKLKKIVVIGTTGFSKKEENLIKKYSRKIPILKAGNMSLGINLLMYLTEIASKSLGDNFLSKVFEVHHKHKKDYPSGTALMLGKGIAIGKKKDFYKLMGKKYLNKNAFPYS